MRNWLVKLLLDERDRQIVEAELAELYALKRVHDGDPAARRWLARQRRLYPLYLVAERCRNACLSMVATMLELRHDLAKRLEAPGGAAHHDERRRLEPGGHALAPSKR